LAVTRTLDPRRRKMAARTVSNRADPLIIAAAVMKD
jgi:hypothetical protein